MNKLLALNLNAFMLCMFACNFSDKPPVKKGLFAYSNIEFIHVDSVPDQFYDSSALLVPLSESHRQKFLADLIELKPYGNLYEAYYHTYFTAIKDVELFSIYVSCEGYVSLVLFTMNANDSTILDKKVLSGGKCTGVNIDASTKRAEYCPIQYSRFFPPNKFQTYILKKTSNNFESDSCLIIKINNKYSIDSVGGITLIESDTLTYNGLCD